VDLEVAEMLKSVIKDKNAITSFLGTVKSLYMLACFLKIKNYLSCRSPLFNPRVKDLKNTLGILSLYI
jgi:hypothetical protein